MFIYDVVSESVRNPQELAAQLSRRSAEGWEVVQIVSDGDSWIHAFVRRAGTAPQPKATVAGTGSPLSPAPSSTSGNTSAVSANTPANWYPDPSKRYELRYWNGSAWTEHVATGGVQSTDQPK